MDKKAYDKQYYIDNRDKLIESAKIWAAANKHLRKKHVKKYWLKYKYGLSLDDYNKLLKDQNNTCAICLEIKPLQVDHCHKTKTVRGLLCDLCNRGLGMYQENINNMKRAINYMERNNAG